jgi:hypothetical protein
MSYAQLYSNREGFDEMDGGCRQEKVPQCRTLVEEHKTCKKVPFYRNVEEERRVCKQVPTAKDIVKERKVCHQVCDIMKC